MTRRPKLRPFFLRLLAIAMAVIMLASFVTYKVNQELERLSQSEQMEYVQANTLLLPILMFVSAKTLKREKDR